MGDDTVQCLAEVEVEYSMGKLSPHHSLVSRRPSCGVVPLAKFSLALVALAPSASWASSAACAAAGNALECRGRRDAADAEQQTEAEVRVVALNPPTVWGRQQWPWP